ncbi:hypothetical protein DB313_02165 [Borrelia turcica IST7]|uniref:Uncharacterized protein n=1 Tax=Borrelia turcica IST7 TaxID=1104446 RepID=A0A386PND7_9SPIR|nr:hypothetical protein DB313_02165 [Borrelia turcica IST7]
MYMSTPCELIIAFDRLLLEFLFYNFRLVNYFKRIIDKKYFKAIDIEKVKVYISLCCIND